MNWPFFVRLDGVENMDHIQVHALAEAAYKWLQTQPDIMGHPLAFTWGGEAFRFRVKEHAERFAGVWAPLRYTK